MPQTDTEVRYNPSLTSRKAYETSLAAKPNYADGTPRPSWHMIGDAARWSWLRPTQRP